MDISIETVEGKMVIAPSGDVDMHSSPALRNAILDQTGQKAATLIVDFSSVSYIDSSGIATLVEGLKVMNTYGGRLQLTGMTEAILEIFRFSKLDTIFEIYGDLDDALGS
jgi:anti-sigma B factor antagonist